MGLQAHSNKSELGNSNTVARTITHHDSYEAAHSTSCCRKQLSSVSKTLHHSRISKALSQYFLWHTAISTERTARSAQGPLPNYQVLVIDTQCLCFKGKVSTFQIYAPLACTLPIG